MQATTYFESTLFNDRNPAADEYYERSVESVFRAEGEGSEIDVLIHTSRDLSDHCFHKAVEGKVQPGTASLRSGEESKHMLAIHRYHHNDHNIDTRLYYGNEDAQDRSSARLSTADSLAPDYNADSQLPKYQESPILKEVRLRGKLELEHFAKETQQDFRVFCVRQKNSNSRLQVTREVFEQLLKSSGAFPRFAENVIGFGRKNNDAEIGPPPMRYKPLSKADEKDHRGFECSYVLRYTEYTNRGGRKQPWSLRQFAVYHRFEHRQESVVSMSGTTKPSRSNDGRRRSYPERGNDLWCSTWILVGASQRAESRLDQYTRGVDDLHHSDPYELHLIFLDTAIASWRPYLIDLTQELYQHTSMALGTTADVEDDLVCIDVEDHQRLKNAEDQVTDLLLCLDSTMDIIATLTKMYEQYQAKQDAQLVSAYRFNPVLFALGEKSREISYTRKKAEALLSRIQSSRTLISSLIERQTGLALKTQVASLEKLELQAQDESTTMRELAEKSSRDSSSVKILTVITLIYLPCTVVSNFYSTQFVSQAESATGETFIKYNRNAWMFFAISIPLTFFTVGVWYSWVRYKEWKAPSTTRCHGSSTRRGGPRDPEAMGNVSRSHARGARSAVLPSEDFW